MLLSVLHAVMSVPDPLSYHPYVSIIFFLAATSSFANLAFEQSTETKQNI